MYGIITHKKTKKRACGRFMIKKLMDVQYYYMHTMIKTEFNNRVFFPVSDFLYLGVRKKEQLLKTWNKKKEDEIKKDVPNWLE